MKVIKSIIIAPLVAAGFIFIRLVAICSTKAIKMSEKHKTPYEYEFRRIWINTNKRLVDKALHTMNKLKILNWINEL